MIREFFQRAASLASLEMIRVAITHNTPTELVLVPQDLRTEDPALAQAFYNGIYSFAGHQVDTRGESPFLVEAQNGKANEHWQAELHSFRWLRHLRSSDSAISSNHAQVLVRDWMLTHRRPRNQVAWQPEIAARRLIAWLCHSTMILDQADAKQYRQFLISVGTHIKFLRMNVTVAAAGLARLQVLIALAYAALCVRSQRPPKGVAANRPHEMLATILASQIFADGGHISRCPSILPEIMVDLLPLRQAYESLGVVPPPNLLNAMDRMMPAIRYYRHRDGNFARFNGVGASEQNLIATVLRYDDAMGNPTEQAIQSGYQKLVGGPTSVLIDVGPPPQGANSGKAHAGCLSFEMSSLRTCFITNCGAPAFRNHEMVMASRSTAAHSTAVLNDTSSCRFQKERLFSSHFDARIVAGPRRVHVKSSKPAGFTRVVASHDGYLRRFGVWHERTLQLSDDGSVLFGSDSFFVNGGKPPANLARDDCTIRFHLHPSVEAQVDADNGIITISASESHFWKFTCDAGRVGLEESIFFATSGHPQPTTKITIDLSIGELNVTNWRFEQFIGTRLQQ